MQILLLCRVSKQNKIHNSNIPVHLSSLAAAVLQVACRDAAAVSTPGKQPGITLCSITSGKRQRGFIISKISLLCYKCHGRLNSAVGSLARL